MIRITRLAACGLLRCIVDSVMALKRLFVFQSSRVIKQSALSVYSVERWGGIDSREDVTIRLWYFVEWLVGR